MIEDINYSGQPYMQGISLSQASSVVFQEYCPALFHIKGVSWSSLLVLYTTLFVQNSLFSTAWAAITGVLRVCAQLGSVLVERLTPGEEK